jgi:hypothetical protein
MMRKFCSAVTSFPCEPRVRLTEGKFKTIGVDARFGVHTRPVGHPGTVKEFRYSVVEADGAKILANCCIVDPPPDEPLLLE